MSDQGAVDDRDFSSAVSEAAKAVEEQKTAEQEASEKQKPRERAPVLAACLVVLVVVGIYDFFALTAVPDGLVDEEVAGYLRFSVGTLAGEIELFRTQEGRLPTAADLQAEDLLDEGISYVLNDQIYTITATDDVVTVTYESTASLGEWVETGGAE